MLTRSKTTSASGELPETLSEPILIHASKKNDTRAISRTGEILEALYEQRIAIQ